MAQQQHACSTFADLQADTDYTAWLSAEMQKGEDENVDEGLLFVDLDECAAWIHEQVGLLAAERSGRY